MIVKIVKHKSKYGIPGNKANRCATHKENGMITSPTKKCSQKDCKEIALFGEYSPNHCEKHKQPNEIDLVQKKCITCGLIDIVNQKGECKDHDPSLMNRGYLKKQKRIKILIETESKHKIYSYDKVIDSKCSAKRPDFVI